MKNQDEEIPTAFPEYNIQLSMRVNVSKHRCLCVYTHSPSTEGRAVRDNVDSQRAVLSQDLNCSSQATQTCVSPKQKHKKKENDRKILVKDQSDWYKFSASTTAFSEKFSASSASFTFRET